MQRSGARHRVASSTLSNASKKGMCRVYESLSVLEQHRLRFRHAGENSAGWMSVADLSELACTPGTARRADRRDDATSRTMRAGRPARTAEADQVESLRVEMKKIAHFLGGGGEPRLAAARLECIAMQAGDVCKGHVVARMSHYRKLLAEMCDFDQVASDVPPNAIKAPSAKGHLDSMRQTDNGSIGTGAHSDKLHGRAT
eukprot:CAMPEP_0119365028 /NCGR_PEP_ID=MMETSP1334-20130426/11954_1 /TAXON_ID=127549 /ORGANISM="Calcidiscus leptoporus, Strain RCC1130" /LENGTH=199 /DNA_ID=CAMNT_0007380883 /DNA_START=39 /DNA_END=638 /DNA_ORIENTATION=+